MNEHNKLVEEQFNKLPRELQLAVNNVPWKSLIKEIVVSNNLSLEQIENVERETMFILYGFQNPNDYIRNLVEEAEISESIATTISQQVNEKILKQIASHITDNLKAPVQNPPIATAQQTKEEIKKQLIDRREQAGQKVTLPEIAPEIHPMVEEGEVAHDIAPAMSAVSSKKYEVREVEKKEENLPPKPTPTPTPPVQTPPTPPAPPTPPTPSFVPKPETPIEPSKPETKLNNPPAPPTTHYPPGQDPYREPIE